MNMAGEPTGGTAAPAGRAARRAGAIVSLTAMAVSLACQMASWAQPSLAKPEVECSRNGALAVRLTEHLMAEDFFEAQRKGEWVDVLSEVEHGVQALRQGPRVESPFVEGVLTRTAYAFPGEAVIIWEARSAEGAAASCRLGLRLPATALQGMQCRTWVFHARAEQEISFPLDSPESLPSPLNQERAHGANMGLRSAVFDFGHESLRIDLDGDAGSTWQLYWQGEDVILSSLHRYFRPGRPLYAVARLQFGPEVTFEPRRVAIADLASHGFSLTPTMSKRGLYVGDETVKLGLHALSLSEEPRPQTVRYRVSDYYGEEVGAGEATLFQGGGREHRSEVTLEPSKLGVFRVELEAGEISKEVTFGVIPEPARTGPDRDSVFGIHAILHNPYFPALAAQMGMRWERLWGGNISTATLWGNVESQAREFEWYDAQISVAREQRLNILGVLGGRRPEWIASDPTKWGDEELAAWDRYVHETVSHYRDDIKYWEVWNEPYGAFRPDQAERYVRILKTAYEAAKQADPEAKIVGTCGPPSAHNWYEPVFAVGGLEYQDIVSAHLYPPGGGNRPLDWDEEVRSVVAGIRDLMRKYGDEKELWNTEAGMSPATPFNRLKAPRYFRNFGTPVPVAVATDAAARIYLVHLAEGVKLFYYLLHGSFEYACALCENDGSPLPAAVAIAVAQSLVDGAEFVKAVSKGPVRCYVFRRGSEGVISLWGVGLQGRRPTFEVALAELKPGHSMPAVEVRDVMGNPCQVARAGPLLEVPISPSPLYLLLEAEALEQAVEALEQAAPPGLERLGLELTGVWDEVLGPTIAVDVTSFEPEAVRFTLAFASLPVGWKLVQREPFGEEGEYAVHGHRRLYFPVERAADAAAAGEVVASIQVAGTSRVVRRRVELPQARDLRRPGPHQPGPEMAHTGVQFAAAGPWTIKTANSGLSEVYAGPEPLLTDFYFYVARKGLNQALLSFRDCRRTVDQVEGATRIVLSREDPTYGHCTLTILASEAEINCRWQLAVKPVQTGWGELGFYVPEQALNDGYPCQLEAVTRNGATSQGVLSAESYPMSPLTWVRSLRFTDGRADWGIELDGFDFRGSHGWHFQDRRDHRTRPGLYRVVLSFSAVEGFNADLAMRLWRTKTPGA